MATPGNETFEETNQNLADDEFQLLLNTSIDWEQLRPKINDAVLYDELIRIVNDATRRNENLSQLKEKINSLGQQGVILTKQIMTLIR
jgi:hypothetical protein